MERTQKVVDCNYWDELDAVLDWLGEVEGSRGIMRSPEETKQAIVQIKEGANINLVTRTHGIRAKVAELLHYKD